MSDSESYFVLLCSAKRQQHYADVIAEARHPVEVVDSPDEALRACVHRPPTAVIVDMITGMRAGSSNTSLLVLYNLELKWPVLRGTTKKTEPVTIVSNSTHKSARFSEALDALHEGEPGWVKTELPRRYIRQEVQCRVRLRIHEEDEWHIGTIIELSAGGCFIISYDPLAEDSSIDIEIQDLGEEHMLLTGRVVWKREWEDSTALPGMGVAFDFKSVPDTLVHELGKCIVES